MFAWQRWSCCKLKRWLVQSFTVRGKAGRRLRSGLNRSHETIVGLLVPPNCCFNMLKKHEDNLPRKLVHCPVDLLGGSDVFLHLCFCQRSQVHRCQVHHANHRPRGKKKGFQRICMNLGVSSIISPFCLGANPAAKLSWNRAESSEVAMFGVLLCRWKKIKPVDFNKFEGNIAQTLTSWNVGWFLPNIWCDLQLDSKPLMCFAKSMPQSSARFQNAAIICQMCLTTIKLLFFHFLFSTTQRYVLHVRWLMNIFHPCSFHHIISISLASGIAVRFGRMTGARVPKHYC